ncbi:MAG: hypothetical protein LBC71_05725, partial [Oscillospiraceae bacterium]|nr:hypothetical protein [Oscillospiraceae bacterium]
MRKIIVLVLSLMFLLILHSEVSATSGGTTIDLMDTNPPASGTGWTFANTVYTIQDGANVTVTSNNSLNGFTIEIAENATATLTLNNAIIGLGNNPLPDGVSALSLLPGANLTIIPLQLSDLASGANAAGIQVPVGTTLTINLTTYGGTLFA